jgi:hypothetical protein
METTMHALRYKVGWFIPQQVMALTHLVPEVTQEDFAGIVNDTNVCLQAAQQPFHMIIDNRIIPMEQPTPLDMILQAMPQLQASSLRWIVIILPHTMQRRAAAMGIQQVGTIQMRFVDTLATALDALRAVDDSLNWEAQAADFFVEDTPLTTNNPV